LDGAVKIAAEARQEVDSLKEELGKLKEKLKEEEASRLVAEARATEKDELLRQSSLALLGNFFYASLSIIALMNSILCQ
jgi:predicted phage gp36 major capsid-like protein